MQECVLCKKDVMAIYRELEKSVIEMIKRENVEWVEADGACPKCIEYYKGLDDMVEIE